MALTTFLLASGVALTSVFIWLKLARVFNRKRREDEPVQVPGHAVFGNAVQFQQDAVGFLLSCAKRCGRIFTLRLLHHYMTIVMDVHAYQEFCRNDAFDFDPIQKQVNWNVFHFKIHNPSTVIRESAKTVRGKLVKPTLAMFCKRLNEAVSSATSGCTATATATATAKAEPVDLNNNASDAKNVTADKAEGGDGWSVGGLRTTACKTVFSAIFYTLFGRHDESAAFNPCSVHALLTVFHRYFNYLWMGLPIQMFPAAHRALRTMMAVSPCAAELLAKPDALPYIRTSVHHMLATMQTDEEVRKHNLVLLHVNYNTFRVAFWALYHLLAYPEARAAVKREVDEFVSSRACDGKVKVNVDDFAHLPMLDSFVKETFRVSSGVFMVRGVTKDTTFTTSDGREYFVRKGDKVAIYPPAIHHDPEIFAEPHKFQHDRFIDAVFYKDGREVRNPLLAFGSLCPGQTMAIQQLKLFLISWVSQIEAELLPGERTTYDKTCYGHEVLPPVNDVQMRYRRVAELEFDFDCDNDC